MESEHSNAKDLSGIGSNAAMGLADLSIVGLSAAMSRADLSIVGLNAAMSLADPGILIDIPESSSVVLYLDRQSSTLLRCTLNRSRRFML
ncbi:MAG: hypothetical protein Q8Q81_13955 [Oxalobacteraceae bacterium]|nr:hypothetical protein [Oxalobacteraceae bacterium]